MEGGRPGSGDTDDRLPSRTVGHRQGVRSGPPSRQATLAHSAPSCRGRLRRREGVRPRHEVSTATRVASPLSRTPSIFARLDDLGPHKMILPTLPFATA